MNLLTEKLPTAVEIDGRAYAVNYDFRTCLKIILAFEDPSLAQVEKQAILLQLFYKEIPDNSAEAIMQCVKFLNGGNEAPPDEVDSERLYSFEKDAAFIYAAFKHTHGIDLETADLHWWKFFALFMDLDSTTVFSNLVNLRSRVKSGKATKEERELAESLGDVFNVPEAGNKTLAELEAEDEFMKRLNRGKNNGCGL